MSAEGFTESDFLLELELYDIIRPPTWQSWNLAASQQKPKSSPASSSIASSSQSASTSAAPTLDPNVSFWKNLESYLGANYDAEETEYLTDVFQAELESALSTMSLDDLERLAKSLVE